MQATDEPTPDSPGGRLRDAVPLLLALAVCLPAPLHFFETFPNGWDQAEYAWCVKEGYLPHSPYVLFVFFGRLVASVLPPAGALSFLSLASSQLALVLLYATVLRLGGDAPARTRRAPALAAVLLLGTSTVFVRHAGTQEVYPFQLCLLLASAALLVSRHRERLVLGGVAYGCAMAAHNASLFVLPAMLVLVGTRSGRFGRVSAVARFSAAAGLVLFLAYGLAGVLLPAASGERARELFSYLRGMPPGLSLAALAEPGFLADSFRGLGRRLVAGDLEVTRGPLATGPVGASVLHFAAALVGLGWLALRQGAWAAAGFLVLWVLPFLLYELTLGWNLDYGIYLVFVLPPLCAACGCALGPFGSLGRATRVSLAAVLVVALAAPSLAQVSQHWGDFERDRLLHDSRTTLAAVFAAGSLPEDAVVIQARSEWNVNLLPFHAERRHVARLGAALRLLRSREPWTPMKPEAYEPLTTERLVALLRAGTPVVAFEKQPLRGANPGALDASRFVWRPVGAADLAVAASDLGLPAARRARLEGQSVPMYRAALAPRPAEAPR